MMEYLLDSPYNYLENRYLKSYCYECNKHEYIEDGCISKNGEKFFCCELCLEAYEIQQEMKLEKIKARSISF